MSYFDGDRLRLDSKGIEVMQKAFSEKAEANKRKGAEDFAAENTRPFTGYLRANSERIFNFGVIYDPASAREMVDRVADPLKRLADSYAIPVLVTGESIDRDLAPHSVLDAGFYYDLDNNQIEQIQGAISSPDFSSLPKFPGARELTKGLLGKTFTLDGLVVAPNTYINSTRFNETQETAFRARIASRALMTAALGTIIDLGDSQLLNDYTQRFRPPYSYFEIFYATVLRINGSSPKEALLSFAQEANATVGKDILQNPIRATVGSVHIGRASDFQMKLGPHMIHD